MKRYEDVIDRTANAYDISEAERMRQDLRQWKEESLEKLRRQDQEQAAKEFQAIQSWLRVDRSDQLTTFDSIADQGDKYPGTCDWILKNSKVQSWSQLTPQMPVLWLSGSAGTGKSVISTQLIKNTERLPGRTVIYHYCTNSSVAVSGYEQVLKSLLEQLLHQDPDLTAHVYYHYVLKKQIATLLAIEQLLQSLVVSSSGTIDQPSHFRFVLDGVDELPDHSPNSQARLVGFLRRLASNVSSSEKSTCKILISGRPSTTLSHLLRRKPTVSLTVEKPHLDKAIHQYALQRLGSLQNRFQQLGMGVQEVNDIGRHISNKSDGKFAAKAQRALERIFPNGIRGVYANSLVGMFLYARLVLDYVSSNLFVRSEELKNAIQQLPKKLADL